jgi:hypothetical protein
MSSLSPNVAAEAGAEFLRTRLGGDPPTIEAGARSSSARASASASTKPKKVERR